MNGFNPDRDRRRKFRSGGSLRGFPRELNFVRVRIRAMCTTLFYYDVSSRERPLRVRAVFRVRNVYERGP